MAYAETDVILPARTTGLPEARRIHLSDLRNAFARGLDDFKAMPTHVIFLCLIYPVIGLLLANSTFNANSIALLYPLAAGFALVGPLAGVWLFELSRRRELGMDTSWHHAFDIVHSPSLPGIIAMGALLLAIFGLWIACAQGIYTVYFGYQDMGIGEFVQRVLTTPEGHRLIIAGNLAGFGFAVIAGSISVISFPRYGTQVNF